MWTEQLLFQAVNKPRDRTAAESDSGPSCPSSPRAEPEGNRPGPRKSDFTLAAVTSQPGADGASGGQLRRGWGSLRLEQKYLQQLLLLVGRGNGILFKHDVVLKA